VIAKRPQLYWPGCVESRPGALSVNDTTPNPNIPNTLFVPAFAPDEPGQSSSATPDSLDAGRTVVVTESGMSTTTIIWKTP
jgi:hypothetical protein